MFELTIFSKDGRELKRYELNGTKPIKIGRAIDCDIKIAVPEVSRRHAQIEQIEDDEWVIKDLGSTHGCLVKGERIREVTITPGLEVSIGPALLRFENMAARIGAELDRLLSDEADDSDARDALPELATAAGPDAETVGQEETVGQTEGAKGAKKAFRLFGKKK
ncbi:MAG TPA: hypothetical protein DEB06_02870 [Phycisphaerales bacterium]|nr:hypothetical protein [Phycisphaerales bacterium]